MWIEKISYFIPCLVCLRLEQRSRRRRGYWGGKRLKVHLISPGYRPFSITPSAFIIMTHLFCVTTNRRPLIFCLCRQTDCVSPGLKHCTCHNAFFHETRQITNGFHSVWRLYVWLPTSTVTSSLHKQSSFINHVFFFPLHVYTYMLLQILQCFLVHLFATVYCFLCLISPN